MVTTPVSNYGESTKPVEIDEGEDIERLTSLKQRETLIRGMGESIKVIHSKKMHKAVFFSSMLKVLLTCVTDCYSERRVPWRMYR